MSFAAEVRDAVDAVLATARAQHPANARGSGAPPAATQPPLPVITVRSSVGFGNCLRRARATCIVLLAASLSPSDVGAAALRRAFTPMAASHPRAALAVVDELQLSVRARNPLRDVARAALREAARRNGRGEGSRDGDLVLVLRRVSLSDDAVGGAAAGDAQGGDGGESSGDSGHAAAGPQLLATVSVARSGVGIATADVADVLAAHQRAFELLVDDGDSSGSDTDAGATDLDPAAAAARRAARADAAVARALERDDVLADTHSVLMAESALRVTRRGD
jgi:hypothetical protein